MNTWCCSVVILLPRVESLASSARATMKLCAKPRRPCENALFSACLGWSAEPCKQHAVAWQGELAASVTLEQGKTLPDARGDVFRGLGEFPPRVAAGLHSSRVMWLMTLLLCSTHSCNTSVIALASTLMSAVCMILWRPVLAAPAFPMCMKTCRLLPAYYSPCRIKRTAAGANIMCSAVCVSALSNREYRRRQPFYQCGM